MKRFLTTLVLASVLLVAAVMLTGSTSDAATPIGSTGWMAGNKPVTARPYHYIAPSGTKAHSSATTDQHRVKDHVPTNRSTLAGWPHKPVASSLPPEVLYQANVAFKGYFDDGSWGPLDIGFDFTFFGNTYTQFYATSNGWVTFDTTGLEFSDGAGWSEYSNSCIPDPNTPNDYIAAFWNDIVIHENGGVIFYQTIGTAPNRKCVIQFTNMGFYGDPTLLGTFSIILYETTNEIQVQYRIIVDNTSDQAHGAWATIGVENADGSDGAQYSCGGGDFSAAAADPSEWTINSEQAIRFTPEGQTYAVDGSALYDGILLGAGNPPSIPQLTTPSQGSVVSLTPQMSWLPCDNTTSYEFLISENSTLEDGQDMDLGMETSITPPEGALVEGTTYYWAVFAHGDDGTTWSEIRSFTTSSDAPPTANPQTVWTTLGADALVSLDGTGGNGPLSAVITSLPAHGSVFQFVNDQRGEEITSTPTDVTDSQRRVIFSVDDGITGSGRGNFEFLVKDTSGWESPSALVTVNVYPAPAVQTAPVVVTDSTGATCGGNVTADGGSEVTARGICWGTTINPTIAGYHSADDTGLGIFASVMTDLTPRERYYVRAYAQNSSGIAYGNQVSFYAGLARVSVDSIIEITASGATAYATVSADGGSSVSERGVCWSTLPNPAVEDSTSMTGSGVGSFVATISGLESSTQYHVRAFATNDVGTAYGPDLPITTAATPTYAIAGHVVTSGNVGIDSVDLIGLPGDPRTNAEGAYIAFVPEGWSGKVVPKKENYLFTPDSIYFDSVVDNQTNEDFVGTNILSDVQDRGNGAIPRSFALGQNYPNPFNPSTVIEFALPRAGSVTLKIYNVVGQEVCTLVDQNLAAGSYQVSWKGVDHAGRTVSSGIYFYSLRSRDYVSTRRMVFLK